MYENLELNLSLVTECSPEELAEFIRIIAPRPKSVKRKDFLLREGDICRDLFFIKEGCLRYFYITDGEEKTGQFFFENGWYTDLESFLTGQPARQFIQALEPCELLCISKEHLEEAYRRVPVFERFGRKMAERAFLGIRGRNENLTQLSPEAHYLYLIEKRPKVIQRVALRYIASYLNIKPESLSRIRKRLFTQDTKA
jgi:CRP-like cAMP-binding protein